MRLDEPRLAPLEPDAMPKDIAAMFGDFPQLNIIRTLAHHPDLMKPWMAFGTYILGGSTLSPRDREIAILRLGSRCRSGCDQRPSPSGPLGAAFGCSSSSSR